MANYTVVSGSSTVLGASDIAYINGFVSKFKVDYSSEDGVITLTNKSTKAVYEFSAEAGAKLAFLNGAVTVGADGKVSLKKAAINPAIKSIDAFSAAAATAAAFTLTTGADAADDNSAVRGALASNFKFTSGNETVTAISATITAGDTLLDASTSDSDTLNITASAANAVEMLVSNIENVNVNSVADAATLDTTSWTGVKNVTVTGTGNVALNDVDAQNTAPTFGISGYKQIATVNVATLAGTAAGEDAETVNLSVSGATWGTTAATQSGITITADVAGTLETLNVTSSGSSANDFTLDAGANTTLGTLNLKGSTAQTVRVSHADITGVTVDGSAGGETAVRINREGVAANTATDVSNFTSVDNIIVADNAATPLADLELTNVKSGQTITVVDDMASSNMTFQGATRTAPAASVTLVLDNDTNATDTDITDLGIQNVSTLNLQSKGNASASTAADAINAVGALTGDFTTINVSGDTSASVVLAIDAAGADANQARTVTVSASGLTGTAFATFTVDNDASAVDTDRLIAYNITGSANADTITATNADAGNTLAGAAGNDTITGGAGNDVITGGDGVDLINITVGADTVTGGAGNDIIDTNISTVAVAQVNTITLDNGAADDTWTAGDTVTVTLNGVAQVYTVTAADVAANEADAAAVDDATVIATSVVNMINNVFGATVTATSALGVVTVTADTAGTPFTLTVADSDAAATSVAAATAAVNVGDVNTTITDFAVGDVINLAGLALDGAYVEGTPLAATDYQVIVLTGAGYATAAAASAAVNAITDEVDSAVIVYLNTTSGNAQAYLDNNLAADAVTNGEDALLFTFSNITTLAGLATVMSSDSFVIA